jgi:eukaryotic-like serine/threonine-protein kinase
MTNCEDLRPVPKIIADRYIVRKIICGGMGVIYQCEDRTQNNLPVALKTFKPHCLTNQKFRTQFLHEATIWLEIGWHPNIVEAYRMEYIRPTREIYLVLDWLQADIGDEDTSLRSKLRQGKYGNIENTLGLLLDVTRGMKYACSKIPGLIHRDLKPENIHIGADGRARISDFGLVFTPTDMHDTLNGSSVLGDNSRLKLGGTPLYMSPEQWRNRKIAVSSDIYALGCIGLEMLSGEYVVRGRHLKTIAEEHMRGGALKRLAEVDMPSRLRNFLAKCLQTNPNKRYQDWDSVEGELIKLQHSLLKRKFEAENFYLDVSRLAQMNRGEAFLAIGEAYLDMSESSMAIKCFERARKIGIKQEFTELVASAEANLGLAYCKLCQYELAVYHFQRAIPQYWECGNIEEAFLNYGNISNVYYRLGDYKKAQETMAKVISYSQQISDDKMTAFWNSNLNNTILNCEDKKSALEFLLYTLEVEEKQGSNKLSVKFIEMLDQFICGVGKV